MPVGKFGSRPGWPEAVESTGLFDIFKNGLDGRVLPLTVSSEESFESCRLVEVVGFSTGIGSG